VAGSGPFHPGVVAESCGVQTSTEHELKREYRYGVPVERSPEKAGVGGSIPSLATTSYQIEKYSTYTTVITLVCVEPQNRSGPRFWTCFGPWSAALIDFQSREVWQLDCLRAVVVAFFRFLIARRKHEFPL